MRKVFVFWSFILLTLIIGISAVVYSKIRLNEERRIYSETIKKITLAETQRTSLSEVRPKEDTAEEAIVENGLREGEGPVQHDKVELDKEESKDVEKGEEERGMEETPASEMLLSLPQDAEDFDYQE